jgi:hypothetical protein
LGCRSAFTNEIEPCKLTAGLLGAVGTTIHKNALLIMLRILVKGSHLSCVAEEVLGGNYCMMYVEAAGGIELAKILSEQCIKLTFNNNN